MQENDTELARSIKNGDRKAWNLLIKEYYDGLLVYILSMTKEKEFAEEILQDVFTNFWIKRKKINITTSIKSYLYRSARNTTLNSLKRKRFEENYHRQLEKTTNFFRNFTEEDINYDQLKAKIFKTIDRLPETSKEIFKLSRFSGMTYKEISEILNISTRSVHYQIGIALKILRKEVVDSAF